MTEYLLGVPKALSSSFVSIPSLPIPPSPFFRLSLTISARNLRPRSTYPAYALRVRFAWPNSVKPAALIFWSASKLEVAPRVFFFVLGFTLATDFLDGVAMVVQITTDNEDMTVVKGELRGERRVIEIGGDLFVFPDHSSSVRVDLYSIKT